MTKATIQPLESYRLARYAMPVPCYICETDNTFDAEYCGHCAAPMALAHQANDQKQTPQMVAVIGASGVGKTVYLGMLMDMLSRQPDRLQVLLRGAFSINLQHTTLSALSRCEFPRKTPNEPDRWNWVHCEMRRHGRRHAMQLIMPDMAGEAVLEEVDHPHTFRIVQAFFKKCTGAIVLIDAAKLMEGEHHHDCFTLKLLSYLSELDDNAKTGWSRRPVALILSKTDRCEEATADPDRYAKHHATGLWQYCQERFQCRKFFAASVAGTCVPRESMTEGYLHIPLRIEPHGIIEPFEWLLSHLKK